MLASVVEARMQPRQNSTPNGHGNGNLARCNASKFLTGFLMVSQAAHRTVFDSRFSEETHDLPQIELVPTGGGGPLPRAADVG